MAGTGTGDHRRPGKRAGAGRMARRESVAMMGDDRGMMDENQTALSRGEQVRDGGIGDKAIADRSGSALSQNANVAGAFLRVWSLQEKGGN